MRARALQVAVLAAVALATAPAAGGAMDMMGGGGRVAAVTMPGIFYSPAQLSVVTGDTVRWTDLSGAHTVNADGFSSGTLGDGDVFTHRFTTAGSYAYRCLIHPFMTGEVDVFDLLLDAPPLPAAPGRPYPLRGRAALPEGATVTIEGDSGTGFQTVTTATVASDGTFAASVSPSTTTSYRAVSDTMMSPAVRLTVTDHTVAVTDVRRRGVDHLSVRVTPAAPGGMVMLQLNLREHFGWWPVVRGRLDAGARAHFAVRRSGRTRARVVLTLPDGWTQLALSPTVTVGARGRSARR